MALTATDVRVEALPVSLLAISAHFYLLTEKRKGAGEARRQDHVLASVGEQDLWHGAGGT
jgi:hypothetical protein